MCGMLAPLLLAAFITATALLTTDYTPLYDTISYLGARGRPYANLMNSGFVISGLLIGAFSYGLYRRMGRGALARIMWLLLAIDSIGIVLSGVFQANSKVPGLAATPEGILHSVFAYIAFFAFLTGIATFARLTYRDPAWRSFTPLSVAVFVINLVLVVVYIGGASWAGIGALELAFFGVSLVWLVSVSLRSLGGRAVAVTVAAQPR
jgi:hypothetical membrane protein